MTITRLTPEEIRLRAALERVYELHQDLVQAIGADQETGSHHTNNTAAVAWAHANPRTLKALGDLAQALDEWGPA